MKTLSKNKKTALITISIVVIAGIWLFDIKIHWSSAISARVVDSETNQPLANVIVVANWEIKGLEGYPLGQVAIFEVTTDATGQFKIPAWGPRISAGGEVGNSEPTVRVFLPGYVPRIQDNFVWGY